MNDEHIEGFVSGFVAGLVLLVVLAGGIAIWNEGEEIENFGSERGFVVGAREVRGSCGLDFLLLFDPDGAGSWDYTRTLRVPDYLEAEAVASVGMNATLDFVRVNEGSVWRDDSCERYLRAVGLREVSS